MHKIIRTKNQEPRTKNQEPRTKNQEPRAKGGFWPAGRPRLIPGSRRPLPQHRPKPVPRPGVARFAADGARRTAAVLLLTLAGVAGIPQQAAAQPCAGDTAPEGAVWTACLTVGEISAQRGESGYHLQNRKGSLVPSTFLVEGVSHTVSLIENDADGFTLLATGLPRLVGVLHVGSDELAMRDAGGSGGQYVWSTLVLKESLWCCGANCGNSRHFTAWCVASERHAPSNS